MLHAINFIIPYRHLASSLLATLFHNENIADDLTKLDTGKATEVDGISAKMLKAVAMTLAPSSTKLST